MASLVEGPKHPSIEQNPEVDMSGQTLKEDIEKEGKADDDDDKRSSPIELPSP